MQEIVTWLRLMPGLWAQLLFSVSILLTAMALNLLVRRVTARQIEDGARRYAINKATSYSLSFGTLLILVIIWAQGGASLAAYLGIVSAGLAIALQDPLTNVAGWFFLVINRPFVVGDRIQIGDHAGDVIDVRIFQFSIIEIGNWVDADQSTGRILHMPNSLVFRKTVSNYTHGFNFIWDELPVIVTFESNWQRAKQILSEIADTHSAVASDHAANRSARQRRRISSTISTSLPLSGPRLPTSASH